MSSIKKPKMLKNISFLIGDEKKMTDITDTMPHKPFDDAIIDYLNDVSQVIMRDERSKAYPDVVTYAFWIRKASVIKLNERFNDKGDILRYGRGVSFHIAPSNVPVNFAYSLAAGLLSGNSNIVRVPSKAFMQVDIICDAMKEALKHHEELSGYVVLVRYGHDKEINDFFSSMADIRIVWGGDNTISELRESPLPARSVEITFADRYSIAVIDSDSYMDIENKRKIAEGFYNDTFISDQNACTSPRIVIWTGNHRGEAKKVFWEEEHYIVKKKYTFQDIQGVDKLTGICHIAASHRGCRVEPHEDNMIIRINVPEISDSIMDYKGNSGYFLEYDCEDIMEIRPLCDDKRCQTLSYIGDREMFLPLMLSGIRGVDRIVPIGKTMDFDLIWDGYDLVSAMTRIVYN